MYLNELILMAISRVVISQEFKDVAIVKISNYPLIKTKIDR